MWVANVLGELRRRRVFRMTAYYIMAGWVAIQVASEALPALGLDESAIRYAWLAVFAGFPVAVIFGWKYDITPHGIRRTALGTEATSTELRLGRTDYVLLSGLALLALTGLYSLTQRALQERVAPDMAPQARAIHPGSIAVLPLANFTGDPGQDYFVAGMHEAVISTLAGISSLRVISRTSTETYRGAAKPLPQIGRELGVANLVEGSVTRAGDVVRITVQLIRATTDEHLWAATYERRVEDVLRLQAEVARAIADQVQAVLTPAETQRLSRVRQVNPAVYEAYLKGTFLLNQQTAEGEEKG